MINERFSNLQQESSSCLAALLPLSERKSYGHPDDPQKKWKYPVGECPPVPRRMFQLRINSSPRSRIIDKDHTGDRCAPEQRRETQAGRAVEPLP